MRVLGIDPGIAMVGFGVIESDRHNQSMISCGVITTPAGLSLSNRLHLIYEDVRELISTFNPDAMAVEEIFFNTNTTTGISVAHGRGLILLAGYKAGVPIFEYTPLQVKQAVVGYGLAEKNQVIDMVRRMLRLKAPLKPDDAADALAIALCHARSSTSLLNLKGGNGACSTI